MLAALPALAPRCATLDLTGARVSDAAVAACVSRLPHLRAVVLDACHGISASTVDALADDDPETRPRAVALVSLQRCFGLLDGHGLDLLARALGRAGAKTTRAGASSATTTTHLSLSHRTFHRTAFRVDKARRPPRPARRRASRAPPSRRSRSRTARFIAPRARSSPRSPRARPRSRRSASAARASTTTTTTTSVFPTRVSTTTPRSSSRRRERRPSRRPQTARPPPAAPPRSRARSPRRRASASSRRRSGARAIRSRRAPNGSPRPSTAFGMGAAAPTTKTKTRARRIERPRSLLVVLVPLLAPLPHPPSGTRATRRV